MIMIPEDSRFRRLCCYIGNPDLLNPMKPAAKNIATRSLAGHGSGVLARPLVVGKMKALELWGGVECTINRVGEQRFNQLAWSGHLGRASDLERFAGLGIRAIRYPVIWEMMEQAPDEIDWSFADERLPRLRELGISVIADLVHHGSGPGHAPIHRPGFATGLARFARAVAERYPWIQAYTPVNEPLTTARFSGLYGLWHPHGRDHRCFVRIVINECAATILAMRAVRRLNPLAKLVQTDDLGHIYSTPQMRYEADFQNERRWLGWDLVSGKVDEDHPLFTYLLENGMSHAEIGWFQEHACAPDIIGINHYPTSDRYLDEKIASYPHVVPADNGVDLHVDVEAVRVLSASGTGFHDRLMEAWQRYRIPLAITECHLGCTREEQIRWFAEAWESAEKSRNAGADVRAVTAWSLLGAFNWNTLVTRDGGFYEPGVFDVRGAEPRPTAIAAVLRALGEGKKPDHPALHHPGWWRRPERLFEMHRALHARTRPQHQPRPQGSRVLLILGARGTLGRAFIEACRIRGLPHLALTRAELDLSDAPTVMAKLDEIRPWAVVNATGYVRVDDAEDDEERCFEVNAEAATRLAVACARLDASLLCFSSDLVFDGRRSSCYLESHQCAPLNAYGRSKAAMERSVLDALPGALVARTSAFFGPWDDWNFLTQTLRALQNGRQVPVCGDMVVSPTYVPDLVRASLDLLIDRAEGIWHLANSGETSWAEFARMAAAECGIACEGLRACPHHELSQRAARPLYSVLGTERGQVLPPLEVALASYAREVRL